MEPREFFINLLGTVPLFEPANVERCLEVLETFRDGAFRPGRWGFGDHARHAYDRGAVRERMPDGRPAKTDLVLRRAETPRYEGRISLWVRPAVRLATRETLALEWRRAFFALGEALADALRPEFGVTGAWWPVRRESDAPGVSEDDRTLYELAEAGRLRPVDYQRFGPWGVGLRTRVGPRLVELIGRERLQTAPAEVTELPDGSFRIDLDEQPWAARSGRVIVRYRRLMDHLRASGVFATPGPDALTFRPGGRWREMPLASGEAEAVEVREPSRRAGAGAPAVRARLEAAAERGEVAAEVEADGVDLRGARLDGLRTTGLRARGACFADASLVGARFELAELEDADLTGADLREASLVDSRLGRARLAEARCGGIEISRTSLNEADLTGADLTRARLDDATFENAVLRDARLERTTGLAPSFEGADLTGARLSAAALEEANFRGADLRGADLSGADLRSCDFRGAHLDRVRWDGANLATARFDPGAEPAI